MTDEIMLEVWRAKDLLARRFKEDPSLLAAELRKRQERSRRKVVNLRARQPRQPAAR